MVRKLVYAMFVMTVAVGFAFAEEFSATITKVDGNKITYQKYKKGEKGKKAEKDGDPVTIEVAKDAKVAYGKAVKKKFEATDDIADGLKADVIAKASEAKGVSAHITTDADNKKVTQILVLQKKKAAQ